MKSNDKTINRKFINIEHRSKKSQIEKEIQDFEDKKSEKIMELGISAYEKIRRGLIDESIFGELTYEIKKLDLEIYNRMLDIANIEGHDEHTPICECGYISKNNEKFCPNCGREIKKDREFILCDVCASKIDSDSKFCTCCGSKIIKKKDTDLNKYEYDCEEQFDYNEEVAENDDEIQVYEGDDFENYTEPKHIIEIKENNDDFEFDKEKLNK
ncbi:zinc ribbon domain-containing protein [Clostridium sp. 2218st1_F5_2218SCRN_220325]|mgnify:FL=1|jgi:RNA polymerase subunit RPABC4/transcription elongation factor Spt4|uniref:zinc ribbon domain-containing protein n=1 Tax=Clostridium sp. 2218st1_F5_2218SCRN_220325 TaxID=3143056 RepID=UPI0025D06781|nr:zinc ribbon domain-containing protein [uncultured Intestinibacter sp.]